MHLPGHPSGTVYGFVLIEEDPRLTRIAQYVRGCVELAALGVELGVDYVEFWAHLANQEFRRRVITDLSPEQFRTMFRTAVQREMPST